MVGRSGPGSGTDLFRQRSPVTLQTEMMECGLACLAMVSRFHGHDVDLNSLREKYLAIDARHIPETDHQDCR